VKVSNQYKKLIMLTLCLLTLVGCTNEETKKKLEENEELIETKQTEEISVEDQKRQEKAETVEKSIVKLIEEENYLDAITHYKNTFIQTADSEIKPTEKTIELYNLAVQKYFEKAETFDYYDYILLSLDMEKLNENVTSLIYQKFSTDIEEIEAFIQKGKDETRERIANYKAERAEREAKEQAKRIEESKNRVYIGMTKEQVLATNWGEPDDINRTITSYGTSEQWVYSAYGKYLYFEDGILVTIQD
jgi:ABC-type enterochelin transport system substrate-binding protein